MKSILIAFVLCLAVNGADAAPPDGTPAQQAAGAAEAASAPKEPKESKEPKAGKADPVVPPTLMVSAIRVVVPDRACKGHVLQGAVQKASLQAPPAVDCKDGKLIGAGDVAVYLPAAVYRDAIAHEANTSHALNVYFNGFNVSNDAETLSAEPAGDDMRVMYHLKPGAQSRAFWSAIIRESGMTASAPLRVGYGWTEKGADSRLAPGFDSKPTIAVSTATDLTIALAVVVVCLAGATLFAAKTGVLRDSVHDNLAPLLAPAQQLYLNLREPGANLTALKQRVLPGFGTGVIDDASCKLAALDALATPSKIVGVDPAVIVGLAGLPSAPATIPSSMSFSLARVQLFAWFMFALLAGVFLKFVYTELPKLDPSILTLLGISAGTAGLSWTIDKSGEPSAGSPSHGFWTDLVTGPENDHQVHRFQSVLVNLALLLIGVAHIVTSIAYPTFDPSWLIFLGISGATYATGKQLVEK